MELSFGFTLLAYYTWWILLLVALVIIIYKLVTQQNFQVSGQAQNSVKAIDCTKKNQNFNSKSGTKMASGQESGLVTANRDVLWAVSAITMEIAMDVVKSLLWMLTRTYHQTMWNNTLMVWSLIQTSMRMMYCCLIHQGGRMT